MKAIVFDQPGDESVLRWADAPDPVCGPGQVVLASRSTSVNRADLLQRRGFYPPPKGASPILGLEVAGQVGEVADDVTGWEPGDHAMALIAGGGYGSRVVVDARHLMPIPKAVGLPDAGGVAEVFLTAYLNLVQLGGLKAGERVLIHGGSGGVGTAAIQIAKHVGAEVWTTAGGPERAQRCAELGADRAIDYKAEDFVGLLKDAGGVDLVLDIMGAKYLAQHLKALRTDGRLVIIGLQGGTTAEMNLGLALMKRITIVGSTLRARTNDFKATLTRQFMADVWPLLDSGDMKLVVDRRVPVTAAGEAHKAIAAGAQFGKIVLTFDDKESL